MALHRITQRDGLSPINEQEFIMGNAVGFLFILIFLGLGVGVPIYLWVTFNKGQVLRFETRATPEEVQMTSVGQVGASRGWATVTQSSTNISLNYVRSPNILIAFLLFVSCVGIVWSLIYWVMASKKESLTILMSTAPSGNTLVQATSNGFKGRRAAEAIRDALGVAPGAVVQTMSNDTPSLPGVPSQPSISAAPTAVGMIPSPTPPEAPVSEPQPAPAAAPAGWYDDPHDQTQRRYFDGSAWTDHRAPR